MTSMKAFKDFENAALGRSEPRTVQFVPNTRAPIQQLNYNFPYQSYFDQTLLQNALLEQPKNNPIVNPQLAGLTGFGIGLHPSSETPVAIQVQTNGAAGGSTVYVLKPGMTIWPGSDSFSGFTWGLPFGWLGGGLATLLVFQTKDAVVEWDDDNELCFHRATFAIKQPADLTAAGSFNNAPKNWPMRFPWAEAISGSSTVNQKGTPLIMMARPTKVIMALRGATTLAAAAAMRMAFQQTNDLSVDATGASSATPSPVFEDVNWPLFNSFGTSGNMASHNAMIVREQGIGRLSADDGGMLLIDVSGAARLNGLFVDIARYGKL